MSAYYYTPVLPWTVSEEDEQRFRRILKRMLLLCLLLSLVMPWLPVPKEDRQKGQQYRQPAGGGVINQPVTA